MNEEDFDFIIFLSNAQSNGEGKVIWQFAVDWYWAIYK